MILLWATCLTPTTQRMIYVNDGLTCAVGKVGPGGEGRAARVARGEVREPVVAAHRLHVRLRAQTVEVARRGQIHFEWL